MRATAIGIGGAALLAVAACQPLTDDERLVAGALGGAAAGLVAAEVLEADNNWRVISALGGAAAGTLVARNLATEQCAYARGDGTYVRRPCPA